MTTATWSHTGSGNWSSGANWTGGEGAGGIPGAGQDVVIPNQASAYTVTLDVDSANLNSIAIQSANETLAVGTHTLNVTGTGASAIDLTGGGKITLAGGTINDSGGFNTGTSTSALVGRGTLNVTGSYSGTGTLSASGGILDLFGTIATGTAKLAIGSGAGSGLKIEGMVTQAAAIAISSTAPILEIAAAGNLTISANQTVTGGTIQLDGGTLNATGSSGLTLGNATGVSGFGTLGRVRANGTTTAPTITASGGQLEITSTVTNTSSNLAITIGSAIGDKLLLDAASAAKSLTFSGSAQTLELNTAGTLTLTNALAINSNAVKLDGPTTSALTDNAGISLTTGSITGAGKVTGAVSVSGAATITATGGTLEIVSGISDTGNLLTLAIANGASNILLLDAANTAHAVTFGAAGTLKLNTNGALTVDNTLAVGSATVQLAGANATLTDANGVTLGTGTITGFGKVAANVTASGAATITATGGTLEITGNLVDSGAALTLAVANSASNKMLLDGTASAAQAVTFGANGTLELASNASLTVGTALAVGTATLQLDASSLLTDAAGITLAGGTITGAGHVSNATNITGKGTVAIDLSTTTNTVTANGGTLTLTGAVGPSGPTLVIGTASGSDLKIDSNATIAPVTINNSAQTLEIAANRAVTINSAQTVAAGKILLDTGSTLTDANGISLGANGTITGIGTLNAAVAAGANTATITASGGLLELGQNVSGTNLSLTLSNSTASRLLIDATATAKTLTFATAGSNARTVELAANGKLTLSNAFALGIHTLKLDGSNATFTDSANMTVTTGTITGVGKVAAAVSATGAATIAATGGTLEVTGAVTNGTGGAVALQVGSAAGDTLKLDATGSVTSASFLGANGTLEFNATGTLTVANALAVGGNTLKLDLAGSTLADASGVTLAGGSITGLGRMSAATNVTGYGTVGLAFDVADVVTASGGTLRFTNQVDATTTTTFHIASASGNVLRFDAQVGTNVVNPIVTFDNAAHSASGEILNLENVGLANFHGKIAGFTDHTGNENLNDGIKVTGATSAVLGGDNVTLHVFNGATEIGTITFATSMAGNYFHVLNGTNTIVICFMPGTMIRTPDGKRAVETFQRGDLVLTAEGRAAPVRWVGRQTVSRVFGDPLRVLPIRIKADALGENAPVRDLLVSPDHALLIDGVLVQAGALVNGVSIVREWQVPVTYTYYHIELDDHALILAEEVPAETFVDNINRLAFDNWDEHDALYPEGKPIVEMHYPRAKAYRQVPRPIRERLVRRALAASPDAAIVAA